MLSRARLHVVLALLALAAFPAPRLSAETAAMAIERTGVDSGLAVHLGATDGALEAGLAASGRLVVHGLSLDVQAVTRAREALRAKGLYGVATIEGAPSLGALPYAENLVNLLIADLDALAAGAPPAAEIQRVLVPGGTAWLKRSGTWTATTKPRPVEMDEWPHSLGPTGNNPLSRDKLVRPVTTLKWIDGNSRGSVTSLPVTGQGVFIQGENWGPPKLPATHEYSSLGRIGRMVCRDAYNGVVRWTQPLKDHRGYLSIAGNEVLSTLATHDSGAVLHGYDLGTGRRRSLDHDQRPIPKVGYGEPGRPDPFVISGHGIIYQTLNRRLTALDATTAKVLWTYENAEADDLFAPSLTPDGAIICVGEQKGWFFRGRWPSAYLAAITGLDAKTGAVRWRNTAVAGISTGPMPVTNDRLLFHSTWGILSLLYERRGKVPEEDIPRQFGVIDVKTGRILWRKTQKDDDGAAAKVWIQVGMIRGDEAYLMEPSKHVVYDLETGSLRRSVRIPVLNQRCVRGKATEDFLLLGFGTFFQKDGRRTDQNISRSGCAIGSTPGNGMIYQTSDTWCACFAMMRGYAGYGSEPPAPPLADGLRAQSKPSGWIRGGFPVAPAPDLKTVAVKSRKKDGQDLPPVPIQQHTAQKVRDAWINNDSLPFPDTRAVALDDLQLVSVVNEHRLEARRAGQVVWAFVAGGRITGAPIIHQGRILFGAHDGYVYGLDARTGEAVWRFLAARNMRRIIAYGQLESAWPVYGVVLLDGIVYASAGRHPELDGGIVLWGLDPLKGNATWQKTLSNPTSEKWLTDGARGRRHQNLVINAPLKIKEGKLTLPGQTNPDKNRPGIEIDPRAP